VAEKVGKAILEIGTGAVDKRGQVGEENRVPRVRIGFGWRIHPGVEGPGSVKVTGGHCRLRSDGTERKRRTSKAATGDAVVELARNPGTDYGWSRGRAGVAMSGSVGSSV
jgi:hypothetical protein